MPIMSKPVVLFCLAALGAITCPADILTPVARFDGSYSETWEELPNALGAGGGISTYQGPPRSWVAEPQSPGSC